MLENYSQCSLPELGKVSGDVDEEVDGVAGITPSLHLTRNGLKRHHVTDSHSIYN